MNILLSLAVIVAATQAKSVSNLAEVQSNHKYVSANPRHTAEEWDAIYTAAEVNIPEDTTGLVPGTLPQPEDAGKVFVKPSERVIAGSAAAQGQIPWQVLLLPDTASFGGASLISPEWALTAAHCLQGFSTFRVTLGATSRTAPQAGSVTLNVRQAIIHANYNQAAISNDIGLLRLASAAPLNNFINVIRLPRSAEASNTFAGSAAVVSGWGVTETGSPSNALLYGDVRIITNAECARSYGSVIQATNICSFGNSGRGPCTGDSGGALVVHESDGRYTQVGVVSFGICGVNDPRAYVRVTSYLSWISSHSGIAIRE